MNLSTFEYLGSKGLKVFFSVSLFWKYFFLCLFVFGDPVTIPWLDRQVCLVPDARKAEDSMMYYLEPRKKVASVLFLSVSFVSVLFLTLFPTMRESTPKSWIFLLKSIRQQSNTSYPGREKIDHTFLTYILKFIDNVNIFSWERFHRCWDISPRWLIYWPQEGNFSIR